MMKNIFVKFMNAALFVLPTMAAAGAADADYNCCQQERCGLDLKVEVDWLFWKERSCDLDYVVPIDSGDDYFGSVKSVCPERSSGFRIGIEKEICNKWLLGLRYTHFSNNTSDRTIDVADGGLAAILVPPEKQYTSNGNIEYAAASQDLTLNVVDLEASFSSGCSWSRDFHFFGGIKFANIDRDFKAHYAEDNSDRKGLESEHSVDLICQRADLSSCGLYLGLESSMDLYCNIGFFGRTSFGTLVGKVDQRFSHKGQSGGNDFETDVKLKRECHRLISVFDLSVGLYYNLPTFCNSDWSIEVGYDLEHWFNVSNYFMVNENNNANQVWLERSADGLGFEGPFIRLVGKF